MNSTYWTFKLNQMELAVKCCKDYNLSMVEATQYDGEINNEYVTLICTEHNYAKFLCSDHNFLKEFGPIIMSYRLLSEEDINRYLQDLAKPINWGQSK